MPTTPATGGTTARTVDEQFLDLICNDADLLAAEFDAIIAAEWPDAAGRPGRHAAPPAGTPPAGSPPRRPTPSAARSPGHGTPASADGPGNAHPRSRTPDDHDRQEGR